VDAKLPEAFMPHSGAAGNLLADGKSRPVSKTSSELDEVNTRKLDDIVHLADETKFYWSVLHTAVRLNRNWPPNLRARYAEAQQDALRLGRQIARGTRDVATLADLRVLSMEQIEGSMARMTDFLQTNLDSDPSIDLVRCLIADVSETGRLLFDGVDVRSCRCTDARSARRRLMKHLGRDEEYLLDAADELARLACVEAERLLAACLAACRADGDEVSGNVDRIH
jgi:hypothetical protein